MPEYTDNEALSILQTGRVSLKPVNIVDGSGKADQHVRVYCDLTNELLHTAKGNAPDQGALEWVVKNREGKVRILTDNEKDKQRLNDLEAQLATTNERLAQIVAASQPAPAPVTAESAEVPQARRGRRAAEPSPETAAVNDD